MSYLLLFVALVQVADASLDRAHPRSHKTLGHKKRNATAAKAHVDYNEQEKWGEDCNKDGKKQSPINIVTASLVKGVGGSIEAGALKGKPGGTQILDTGHNFQVDGDFGSFTSKAGEKYKAVQFHFHSPAEHEIDGERAEAEMHIVMAKDGCASPCQDLSVFGILFEKPSEGETNSTNFLESINWNAAGAAGAGAFSPGVNPMTYFSSTKKILLGKHYEYEGGLTTPPCSEIVHWYVFAKKAVITDAQVQYFKTKYPNPANNRNVHDLYGRKVTVFGE